MEVTQEMIDKLGDVRKMRLEYEIICELSDRLNLSAQEATAYYYNSKLAPMVEENLYGVRYVQASYLVDELLDAQNNTGGADAADGPNGGQTEISRKIETAGGVCCQDMPT